MTPTEPNARAELLARLDKWASVYPTWGDTEAERRCHDAAAQIRADAREIQSLAERVRALEAAISDHLAVVDDLTVKNWLEAQRFERLRAALRPGAPSEAPNAGSMVAV